MQPLKASALVVAISNLAPCHQSPGLTGLTVYVRLNVMRSDRLRDALKYLGEALRETENALEEARAEPDPLASHIFISRRKYRNISDTKSGKRTQRAAHASWRTATELGFRGSLGEWERLLGGGIQAMIGGS